MDAPAADPAQQQPPSDAGRSHLVLLNLCIGATDYLLATLQKTLEKKASDGDTESEEKKREDRELYEAVVEVNCLLCVLPKISTTEGETIREDWESCLKTLTTFVDSARDTLTRWPNFNASDVVFAALSSLRMTVTKVSDGDGGGTESSANISGSKSEVSQAGTIRSSVSAGSVARSNPTEPPFPANTSAMANTLSISSAESTTNGSNSIGVTWGTNRQPAKERTSKRKRKLNQIREWSENPKKR